VKVTWEKETELTKCLEFSLLGSISPGNAVCGLPSNYSREAISSRVGSLGRLVISDGSAIWCLFQPTVLKYSSNIYLKRKLLSNAYRKGRESGPGISLALLHQA
jgi:hypothetical protein